jgi:hypothetical protein
VMQKLELLVRFWELRARYDTTGMPLDKIEQLELLSLLRLLATSYDAAGDAFDGSRRGMPVQITAGSGFLAGDLKELSAECLVIGAVEPLPPGYRTIVYVADAITGIEYTVPCIVAWSREDEPCLIGLAPDGVPSRSHFTVPVSTLWRSPLGIGSTLHRVEA